jgi:hypothetical protein
MAGFLVPFLSGGLIKSQQIRDEYDENAGNIVDAASTKYNEQFDLNKKEIELQNSNYSAIENAHGTIVAEYAAKSGLLEKVNTAEVVNHIEKSLTMPRIAKLKSEGKRLEKKGISLADSGMFQSLFSQDYAEATKALKTNRDWASQNLNKGAIKNIADLNLGKDTEPSALGKAQKFMFGDRITKGTGVAFDQAVAQKIGNEITVQPTSSTDIKSGISDTIGFQETVYAGSINDINKAITSTLGLESGQGFSIDANNNFLFDTRFIPDSNSIRANVSDVAATYQFMSADGKPDTNKIVQMAHEIVRRDIVNPSLGNFQNPNITNKNVFEKSRTIVASGLTEAITGEIENFNPNTDIITDKKLESKKKRSARGTTAATLPQVEVETGNFLVSEKVADVFLNKINEIPYREDKLTYISYMADNFYVKVKGPDGGDAKMKLKTYVTEVLGLRAF